MESEQALQARLGKPMSEEQIATGERPFYLEKPFRVFSELLQAWDETETDNFLRCIQTLPGISKMGERYFLDNVSRLKLVTPADALVWVKLVN